MIYILLPAYNEEIALPKVVRRFAEELNNIKDYKIIAVDDGSQDGTSKVAKELAAIFPLTLIQHEVNEGLGKTMVDGLTYIADLCGPGDMVVTLDCDDTHDPKYVHAALAKARSGYDVVILSRYQKGGGESGLSTVKSVLSRGAGLFLKFFFPIKGVKEYSCGYRVLRAETLKRAFRIFGKDLVRLPHMGFVVTPELLIKFRMIGARITEVPFVLNYGLKPTPSKNRPIKTILGYFALVWLYWGRPRKENSIGS